MYARLMPICLSCESIYAKTYVQRVEPSLTRCECVGKAMGVHYYKAKAFGESAQVQTFPTGEACKPHKINMNSSVSIFSRRSADNQYKIIPLAGANL
jgi:hypothetical protein